MEELGQILNRRSAALCAEVAERAAWLDVDVRSQDAVETLDFATDRPGTLEGGIWLARICLADLADVQIQSGGVLGLSEVQVRTDHPLWACLAAQYAGWPFSVGDYFAMGSGPARMARGEEALLIDHGWAQPGDPVVGVFESGARPDARVSAAFLAACGANRGYFCVARTASFPGSVQVVARSIETTLHKLHELGFELARVRRAMGTAPLPPLGKNDLEALGWTNDAILYGGDVTLWVDADEPTLRELAVSVPSQSSPQFGRPFLELFEAHGRDFYQVDRMLFSPARVQLHSLRDGSTVVGGAVHEQVLAQSFRMN